MAHGNIYRAEKIDAALANYFRVGNLSALRELALLWLADKVDAGLEDYRSTRASPRTGPRGNGSWSRCRVVPRARRCCAGAPESHHALPEGSCSGCTWRVPTASSPLR